MNDGKKASTLILLASVALLLAYDFFAVWRWGYEGTISQVIYQTSKGWPILPFLAGLICGHFFFPVAGGDGKQ